MFFMGTYLLFFLLAIAILELRTALMFVGKIASSVTCRVGAHAIISTTVAGQLHKPFAATRTISRHCTRRRIVPSNLTPRLVVFRQTFEYSF